MNKKIIFSSMLLLGVFSLTFTGCSDDDDTTPPVVTLLGDPSPELYLQTTYVDPGATAVDDEDGTVAVTVSGTVDRNKVDVYVLTYTAVDAAGNEGTATRTVTYVNQLSSDPFEGNYSCVITTSGQPNYNYTENLSVSSTINNALEWSKFGDYGNANAKLNFFRVGTQITVPTQTIICGNPAVARTFDGSGTTTGSGGVGSTIVININETVNSVTQAFVYSYTKN